LTWTEPVFNGGSAVIDYRIHYDAGEEGVFEVLVDGLQDTSFIAENLE
jgi:hypothetical protein